MKRIGKYILIAALALGISNDIVGQAKKPELMVMPSRDWCTANGCMVEVDNQGLSQSYPDYRKALDTSQQLNAVIAKISEMMNNRNFPLIDLGAALTSFEQSEVENSLITSSQGSMIAESPLDKIMSSLKADIMLEVSWSVNKTGPKNSITYTLKGIDAYTSKAVATISGTGAPSLSADVPLLLEEAVIVNMDGFTDQLQAHFDDLLTNGREVTIEFRVFDNGTGINLESEYDGEELIKILDDWFYDNTVSHRYSLTTSTENMALFRQVRIPIYDERGRALDTRTFAYQIRKVLAKEPYNLPVKLINKGLGKVILIIGEK